MYRQQPHQSNHRYTFHDALNYNPSHNSNYEHQDCPHLYFSSNLMNPVTPRGKFHQYPMDSVHSPQGYPMPSQQRNSGSIFLNPRKSSSKAQRNSSKQTKINNQVAPFDEDVFYQERNIDDYSYHQSKSTKNTIPKAGAFTTLNNIFEQNQSGRRGYRQQEEEEEPQEDMLLYQKLNKIQDQMVQLNNNINDMEQHFNQLRVSSLGFLTNPSSTRAEEGQQTRLWSRKDVKLDDGDKEQPFRIFVPEKVPSKDNMIQFVKPDDKEKHSIVFMQQNLAFIIGKLSQLLQNQSQIKIPTFKNFANMDEEDERGEPLTLTFNKTLNKFTRIYKCKFCPLKFAKACSLGGHISRVHKAESQRQKSNLPFPLKKTSIQKQRKQALIKSITKQIHRE